MHDIVYILRNNIDTDEIKYSMRSVVKNFPFNSIWIYGGKPKGIEPEYSGRQPDYALSGHTHNGQFFPGNIVINFVWRLAFGEGTLDGVRWLVSAGGR